MTAEDHGSGDVAEAPERASTLEQIVPYQINRLSFRMNQLLNRALQERGMTIAAWRILAVLEVDEAATVNRLAEAAMIEQSTLSRALQRLEAQGYILRTAHLGDGRTRGIALTDAGRHQLDEVRELTMAHVGRILTGFTDEETRLLRSMIARMRRNVEQPLT